MHSIQNTIIEFKFTLLLGHIYKNKAKSEEDIMWDIHILPSFRDSYHPMFPIRVAKRKGANDAKKAKIFTKIGREMAIAIKEGGSANPDFNARLRSSLAGAVLASSHLFNHYKIIQMKEDIKNTDGRTYHSR